MSKMKFMSYIMSMCMIMIMSLSVKAETNPATETEHVAVVSQYDGLSYVYLPKGGYGIVGWWKDGMEILEIPAEFPPDIDEAAQRSDIFFPHAIVSPFVYGITGRAFSSNSTIRELSFPSSFVREIGDGAFQSCTALEKVSLPASLEYLGNFVFIGCDNLKSVEFEPFKGEFDSTQGIFVFRECKSLEQVKLAEGIKNMPGWFEYCTALKEIEIPEGTELLVDTFLGCTALEKVTLKPEEILIVPRTFDGCDKIMTLISYSKDPKDFEYEDGSKREVFSETVTENATLYIPKGTAELYKNTVTWGKFRHVVEMEAGNEVPELVSDSRLKAESRNGEIEVIGLEEQEAVSVYGVDGKLMYSGAERVIRNLPKGEYVVTSGSESVKVIL